ncbi:DUF3806 domain-containing protein [Cellvibrio sp. KY-GH-1]|uniref:DUF3806 domain-containing protein n=1 Tax=Cellvibrio sp. KY-GH-1 TaxID=2303332 RepID=UPI001248AB67|nr:DUF3806 domain-containing protein [Cellvibrio sp. KY-GH-1]QEY14967.1 DUF3806 domain-containing protein [Cellvibrio sp. KY-GH-1]
MKKLCSQWAIFALTMFVNANGVLAQTPMNVVNKQAPTIETKKEIQIKELGWMDKNRMDQETTKINELTQTKLGTPLRRDLSDLSTLQRIVDKELVATDNFELQQAMGVVLGNVMLADFPNTLEWKIYEDELGRSRALCARKTNDCLFPVTMLSRRMEVGTKPNVRKIYDDALLRMEKHLPKLPYDGGIMYRLPR